MNSIKVINGGFLTTVQDRGRYGYQKKGIPVSGVMDIKSYELANCLVGNTGNEAVLEMTALGGTYRFCGKCIFALTGADMHPQLSGKPLEMNNTYIAEDGEVLKLGTAKSGFRTYLAVAGGINVPIVMGSRSTYIKAAIGGFSGRALKSGDIIPVFETANTVVGKAVKYIPFGNSISVRVIPGPQEYMFTEAGIYSFYSTVYKVTQYCDRMGIRLSGAAIEAKNGTDIISDATVFGSIQVTGQLQPIILMADRQTTGGYAKIATVFSEDLPLLAQAKPGDEIRFIKFEQELI